VRGGGPGELRTIAELMKIANDIRWMGSSNVKHVGEIGEPGGS